MPSIKDLKKRITSTKNTQQTTRAMKMVSAAKLRRAQDAILAQRPYAKQIGNLIRVVMTMVEGAEKNPLIGGRDAAGEGARVLLIMVTSDRGLCGGFNTNAIKAAQRWLRENEGRYGSVQLGFVGRKGYEFFKNKKTNNGPYFADVGGKVSFAKARKFADELVAMYRDEQVDEIYVIYNEFRNAISQKVVVERFLPLSTEQADGPVADAAENEPVYLVKPSPAKVFEQLLEKHFGNQAFRILLESQAGEHGARMSAMENATKNAGEMIRKLTLQYNKQRQAGITKELLEIISGSESQKS